jgi:hypothetical protein
MPLRDQIARHFLYHHFPPAPMKLLDTAIAAITAVNEGQGGFPIGLPNGFVVRYDKKKTPTAEDVMQGLNLNAWRCECDGCKKGEPHWKIDA